MRVVGPGDDCGGSGGQLYRRGTRVGTRRGMRARFARANGAADGNGRRGASRSYRFEVLVSGARVNSRDYIKNATSSEPCVERTQKREPYSCEIAGTARS